MSLLNKIANKIVTKNIALIFALLLLFTITASAEDDYDAVFEAFITVNVNGNYTWDSSLTSPDLSEGDNWAIPGSSTVVTYYEYDDNSNVIWIKTNDGDFTFKEGQEKCIKGDCDSTEYGDVKLLLKTLKPSGYSSTTDSDDAVILYVKATTGEKLYLNKDGTNSFNPKEFNQQTGWSSTTNEEEIHLIVERTSSCPIYIDIESDGAYDEEAPNGDEREFILKSNALYTFTIQYEEKDAWDGTKEKENTYSIVISGITGTAYTSGGSSAPFLIPAPYDVISGKPKEIKLPNGQFTLMDGVTTAKSILDNGFLSWKITFDGTGHRALQYTLDSGETAELQFSVSANQVFTDPSNTKKTANKSAAGGTSNSVIFLAMVAIVCLVIYLLYAKGMIKRKPRNPNREEISDL